jgi:AraC-like DNA-binding protein
MSIQSNIYPVPREWLKPLSTRGVNLIELLVALDIEAIDVLQHGKKLTYWQYRRVIAALAQLSGDEAYGLYVGETITPENFNIVNCVAMCGRTVGEICCFYAQYYQLAQHPPLTIIENDRGYVLRFELCKLAHQMILDAHFAHLISFLRWRTLATLKPAVVRFSCKRPKHYAQYRRIFQCNILFEQPTNEIVLTQNSYNLPVTQVDDRCRSTFIDIAKQGMRQLNANLDISSLVKQVLEQSTFNSLVTIETVAQSLNMSKRTLQRKLTRDKTSYSTLVMHFQKEKAIQYLETTSMTIGTIAQLLGYKDKGSFYRVFKRWSNLSPHQYRTSGINALTPCKVDGDVQEATKQRQLSNTLSPNW